MEQSIAANQQYQVMQDRPEKSPPAAPVRVKLPATRDSMTQKWEIGEVDLYIHVSFFEVDDRPEDCLRPAEIFVKVAKHGSDISGLMDGWSIAMSLALQYQVPWESLASKFRHTRYGLGDDRSSSMLDGVVQAVEHLIAERRRKLLG